MNPFLILLLFPLFFGLNFLLRKKNLISNYSGQKHQKFFGKTNIPLSGGFFLFCIINLVLFESYPIFCIFFSLLFLVGFISDINILESPKIKFFLQVTTIFIFVYILKLQIGSTRIFLLDLLLENIIFSYFFTIFCFVTVINGTNFIDGLNGLVLGYYLAIICVLFKLGLLSTVISQNYLIIFLILSLAFLLILNTLEHLYLGDSGAYSIAFMVSFLLILIYKNTLYVSPFFIILMLWYPCFENLFSILRKFRFKRSPLLPDNNHLHQLLFVFFKKKTKINQKYLNNFSSFIIILYNLIIFFLASLNIGNTQFQILLVVFNIAIYLFVYLRILSFLVTNKTFQNK
jgi:UDP-N-acetylmuramyl pentapeptide phosphotransferase/UDP-N-acetylglucosamine-1-phosphate transferase